MSTQEFNVFVDKYETIRKTLRQIFVFGCYDRVQGATKQNISDRKYSNEVNRIRCFWRGELSKDRKPTGKYVNRFPFDRYSGEENYLWTSYCLKAFSSQDLNLYIAVLQILDDDEFKNISAIMADIQFSMLGDSDDDNISYGMLQRRLGDMAEMGLLECRKETEYRLSKNILGALNLTELSKLYAVLTLYREIFPMSSLGYTLQRIIGATILFLRNGELPQTSIFGAEEIFFQNILNDEIFFKLLTAIEQRNFISVQFNSEIWDGVVPLKIILDRQYGRQYLFGIKQNTAFIRRLDNIINVKLLEDFFTPENYSAQMKILKDVWCAAIDFSRGNDSKVTVEVDFNIDDDSERYIFDRLRAESHIGKISELSDKHWLFSVEVIDPRELIPFIRSFGKYAKVRESQQHDLTEKLARNFSDLHDAYENLDNWLTTAQSPPATIHNDDSQISNVAPKIFSEYRNFFFVKVQAACNLILSGKKFTRDSLTKFLCAYDNKQLKNIAANIAQYGGSIKKFSLFKEKSDKTLALSSDGLLNLRELPFLLTTPEKRWLRTLLDDSIFAQFIGEKLRLKLLALLDVAPFPLTDIIVERNFRANNENSADNLKIIFAAMENDLSLKYRYVSASGKIFCGVCFPKKIVYSPYLHKFHLDAVVGEKSLQRMSVANLSELEAVDICAEKSPPLSKLQEQRRMPHKLHLLIKPVNGYNDIERCFLLFSTHEKSGWYDDEKNIYHLEISFHSFEVSALLRKILSLGAAAVVVSPDDIREAILRRI